MSPLRRARQHCHSRLLLPDCLDDYVGEDNLVRVVDVFVDELDLTTLGFAGPAATGRPGYSPATMLKLYLYGYLNRVQSSRRLEREAGRNVECMWLTGKLAPDFKTIADFRRDNGAAIRAVCNRFVILCREIGLIAGKTVAVDGSRFKAVNTRDKNYTPGAIRLRMEQVDDSIARYLGMLDTPIARRTRWRRCGLAGCLNVWRRCAARCGSFRQWSERSRMRLTIRSR
jgi:transposase